MIFLAAFSVSLYVPAAAIAADTVMSPLSVPAPEVVMVTLDVAKAVTMVAALMLAELALAAKVPLLLDVLLLAKEIVMSYGSSSHIPPRPALIAANKCTV